MTTASVKVRGAVALAVLGLVTAGVLMSPVGAAITKGTVKKIAKNQATKVFNKLIDPAIAGKQDACQKGGVVAYGTIKAGDITATFNSLAVSPQFNCAGGPIEARLESTGDYELRIPGVTTPAPSTQTVMTATAHSVNADFATVFPGSADFVQVDVFDANATELNVDVSFAVYGHKGLP